MRLKNKVAIVTGAGSGIGAAVAKLFAREGAKVVVVEKRSGDETVGDIKAAGGEAVLLHADVTKADAVCKMVETTVETYGRLDILHNHAGILVVGDVLSLKEDEWDRCMDTKLKGIFLVSKYAVPYMIKGRGGVIINTSSASAFSPGRGYLAYGAANAAIVMLTKCMALDLAHANIRVNCVCPGPIDTPMIMPDDAARREVQLRRWAEHLPIGRVGKPDDVAQAVLYLVSDEAAFVTGTPLLIDGGRVLVGIGSQVAGEHR